MNAPMGSMGPMGRPPLAAGRGGWYSDLRDLDAKVCYCFHVSRRKLVNFIRINRPRVPSQLSDCGGAGTGCGWCIPFLRQLHRQAGEGGATELEQLAPEEYERRRAAYV